MASVLPNFQDSLERARAAQSRAGEAFTLCLVCGFTPMALRVQLVAAVADRLPSRRIECATTTIDELLEGRIPPAHGVAVVCEWSDLDPRLGVRRAGGWGGDAAVDAVATAELRLGLLVDRVLAAAQQSRVALALPTLELPPVFATPAPAADPLALRLRAAVATSAARCAAAPRVAVLERDALELASPLGARRDVARELAYDIPYTPEHSAQLATALARLTVPALPLKGVITDLDDTLWRGLAGEVGPDGVSWDLDHASQPHALYQQLLASLAANGTLVAAASKNDPEVVAAVLERRDLRLDARALFPVEVGWHEKSAMIDRILAAWNVSADAVAFVDDSPFELEQVRSRHPSLVCLRFPHDPRAVLELCRELRDRCGRAAPSAEDRLRRDGLAAQARAEAERVASGTSMEDFLAGLRARTTIAFGCPEHATRAWELVNKTNQFNINGQRIDEIAWQRQLEKPGTVLVTVDYEDRSGPLGVIGAMVAAPREEAVEVSAWVLSCRAFSRRVEYRMLRALFDRFRTRTVSVVYTPTERNARVREFLAGFADVGESDAVRVPRERFDAACPHLYDEVVTHE
ncbi:MAG TPA: HAD-IIIC family phosphatase [Gammaproteobacteria bacterium]|nr:HAD-IIIC family phosphatase [Gammaproteobacteria bacterium]